MKAALFFLLLNCALESYGHEHGSGVYGVAVFNTRGVRGTIKFFPQENGNVNISVSLQGIADHHSWHIHVLPVDETLDPDDRCLGNIGGHYDPFDAIGTHGSNYADYCNTTNQNACEVGDLSGKLGPFGDTGPTFDAVDTTGNLTLFGRYGIIGRSIRIHGTENVCATIKSSTEMNDNVNVVYLKASFVYPFGGTMYLRQVEREDAIIWGKVFWVTDAGNDTVGHNWHVHEYLPPVEYREGDCSGIEGHYNPFNADINSPTYADDCNPDAVTSCEVGDLSGKHGKLTIPINPLPYAMNAFLFHDPYLNLTGDNAVFNRSIAIHSLEGPVQGCAPLYKVETLSVSDIDDSFTATHTSAFSLTDVETSLSRTNLAVLNSAIAPNTNCRVALSSTQYIYNPHDEPIPDGTVDTPDRHPVGAIGLKYDFNDDSSVSELPIHGIETIAGRSLGSVDGSTYTCSSLWPNYPSRASTMMAKATFNSVVSGAIYFIQRDHGYGIYGNTFIFVDIWYTDSSTSVTTGHNWHIHTDPPQDDQMCVDAIGGHFNPFNVDVSSGNYNDECSDQSNLRCESGDLSGKHGRLNIGPAASDRTTYTYTDNNLNLFGPSAYSIIGRSVGLHLPTGPLFDCGMIQQVFPASDIFEYTTSLDDDFERISFTTMLASRIDGTTASDLLMMKQEVRSDGQTTVSLRALGTSADDANAKRDALESEYGSGAGLSLPSIITLLVLLVLAAIFGYN